MDYVIQQAIEHIGSDRLVKCVISPMWFKDSMIYCDTYTGQLFGESCRGKDVLIIDEYCNYGHRFAAAAKTLHEAGARNVYLAVEDCSTNVHYGDVFTDSNIIAVYTRAGLYHPAHTDTDWRVIIV